MARKTQISEERILRAALDMLIRDGYSSINIKTLAAEIGCSTQPIMWHFESMDGLRSALAGYAYSYAKEQMHRAGADPVTAFENMGRAFIHIAVHEPNLYRFLYLDEKYSSGANTISAISASETNSQQIKGIATYLHIPEENVARYLQKTMIFSYGIATLVATGMLTAAEEEIMTMINQAADAFLMQEGVPADQLPQ